MTYYNTTTESGATLERYRSINSGQDKTILAFFKKNRGKSFTPFAVMELSDLPITVPITSVRRSLSTLTKAGLLVKSDEMRDSPMGRRNHVWTLKNGVV